MGDLNTLAGLEGFLSGISSVAVPTINRRLTLRDEYDLEARRKQEEEAMTIRSEGRAFEAKKAFLPLEEESKIRQEKSLMPFELDQFKAKESFKAGLKPPQTKTKVPIKKSDALKIAETGGTLPEGSFLIDDTPKGDSRTTDQKLRELKQQLAILTTFKDKYKKIGQGPVAKSGTMINKARGQSTPATRYEDQRGAVALNLWSAWTGEKGKFSTTDQELAFGLVPGQYEKGGESKFDDAISLAEFGISELQKGNDLPAIYSAISQFGGKSAGRIKVPGLTGGVSGSGLTPEQRRARIAELQAEPAR